MTAPHIVDPAGLLGDALADASPDLMRSLLQTIVWCAAVFGCSRPSHGAVVQAATACSVT